MLIQCSHCGAPLDVGGSTKVAKCRYCMSSCRVNQTTQLTAVTPAGWRPPPTWTPPANAAAPSTPLRYRERRNSMIVVVAIVGLLVTAVGISAFVARLETGSIGGLGGPAAVDVGAVGLESSITDLALALGVDPDGESDAFNVSPSGSGWDYVRFGWDEAHPDHVRSVNMQSESPAPEAVALRERVRALWGRRAIPDEDGSITVGGASFSLTVRGDGTAATMYAHTDRGGDWRRDARIGWDVLRAGLGVEVPIDDATRRDWLGVGHPVTRIAELDLATTVDDAEAAVQAVLPAAERDGAQITAYVDNPWYDWVGLYWENAPGGALESLRLQPLRDAYRRDEEIAACLARVLGEPTVDVTDHVENRRVWRWGSWSDPEHVRVQDGLTIVISGDAGRRTRESLATVLRAIDECPRP